MKSFEEGTAWDFIRAFCVIILISTALLAIIPNPAAPTENRPNIITEVSPTHRIMPAIWFVPPQYVNPRYNAGMNLHMTQSFDPIAITDRIFQQITGRDTEQTENSRFFSESINTPTIIGSSIEVKSEYLLATITAIDPKGNAVAKRFVAQIIVKIKSNPDTGPPPSSRSI
jgi:hypothetical protein